jgi:hypothetical protein
LNFQCEGQPYRLSLDREAGRKLLGKTEAKTVANQICTAIRDGTFEPRRHRVRTRQVETPPQALQLTFAKFGEPSSSGTRRRAARSPSRMTRTC